MDRRSFLTLTASGGAAAAVAVLPEPGAGDRRWVTSASEEYLLNQRLINSWCERLPLPYCLDTRGVEITEDGWITRAELFTRPAEGKRNVNGDEPATRVVDVSHFRWRWPANRLMDAS